MKHFLTKIFVFSLSIVAVSMFMVVLLRNIPNDYLYKKDFLDNHAAEVENLILGSSHAYYGLNPEYFSDNTFNASHISQSIDYDYELLKKYKDQLEGLKTIVLPISYFTLFERLEKGPESWRVKNYTIYYEINSSKSITSYSEVLANQLKINMQRLVEYYRFNNSAITSSSLGWGTSFNSENARDLIKTGKNTAIKHSVENMTSQKHQKIFDDNLETLNLILQWGESNDVEVLLFTPPAFKTYRRNLNNKQLTKTIKATKAICAKYQNCTYENLLSDKNLVAKDFYDADHLSEIGAKKLSRLIDEKITELK